MRRVYLFITIVLVGLTLILVDNRIQQLRSVDRPVDADLRSHTQDVLRETQGLLSTLEDAESGQRGYLIVERAAYLQPYLAARSRAPAQIEHLAALTITDSAQRARVEHLRQVASARLSVLDEGVRLAAAGNRAAAYALVGTDRGPSLMDAARADIADIQATERQLLARHRSTAQRLAQGDRDAATLTFRLRLLLLAACIAAGAAMFVREGRRRMSATDSALRASDAEARRLAALLTAVGASSPDMIYAKNREGRMLYANPATLAVIGKPADQVIGRTAEEYSDNAEDGRRRLARDLQVIRDGATQSHDETEPAWDGPAASRIAHRTFQSTRAPLKDRDGKIIGLVGITIDMTARVAAERRQAFLIELADQLNAAPRQAMSAAARLLGRHLRASRAGIGEVEADGEHVRIQHEYTDGVAPSGVGEHSLRDFGETVLLELRGGKTRIASDLIEDPAAPPPGPAHLTLDMGSVVTVPLVRDGELRATLYVSHRERHVWSEDEVRLIEEVAARTWAVVEQARAAEALERAADEFRTLANGLPTLCWMAEPDGTIFWYNQRWYAFTGATPEQMAGWGWQSVHDPEQLPKVLEVWRACIAGATPFEMTFPLRGADGEFRQFLTRVAPIFGPDGELRRWFGTNTDVTRAALQEQALRRSEAQFRTTAEALPGLLFVTNAAGENIYVNDGFCTYTGRAAMDLVGDRWVEVVHPDDWASVADIWAQSVTTGAPYITEIRFRGANGLFRWHMVRALPARGEDRSIDRWVGVCTDIHDRRLLEEALLRLNADLETRVRDAVAARESALARTAHAERMEALGQLSGGIAHDLNNVLQAIQGGTLLIEKRADRPDEVRRMARMVLEATDRGASVTRRLLSFSRRADLRAEMISPEPFLSGLREILAHTLGSGIAIDVNCAKDATAFLADRNQLETVLINLATNARDAMPGGGTLTLSAEAVSITDHSPHPRGLAAGPYIRFRVDDTGLGMDAATLEKAMEPFFTTKPVGEGTGLGLSMARGFAEQSGGALVANSRQGEGTAILLWLPLSAPAQSAPPGSPTAALVGQRAMKLLLVDDEAMVRHTLGAELEEAGFKVFVASDAREALALLKTEPGIGVLVTDLTMPGGMDGIALIREAQTLAPGLPTVLVTGYADNGAGSEAALTSLLAGNFSLLRKPVSGACVADRIAALLVTRTVASEV